MNEARYRVAERRLWESKGVTPTERRLHLTRNGVDVRVLEAGNGPPVLFVHGGNVSGSSWAALVARLPGFRCIVLDRPGCGLSDPLAATLSAETLPPFRRNTRHGGAGRARIGIGPCGGNVVWRPPHVARRSGTSRARRTHGSVRLAVRCVIPLAALTAPNRGPRSSAPDVRYASKRALSPDDLSQHWPWPHPEVWPAHPGGYWLVRVALARHRHAAK